MQSEFWIWSRGADFEFETDQGTSDWLQPQTDQVDASVKEEEEVRKEKFDVVDEQVFK